jgi:hypothetical protein
MTSDVPAVATLCRDDVLRPIHAAVSAMGVYQSRMELHPSLAQTSVHADIQAASDQFRRYSLITGPAGRICPTCNGTGRV